MRDVANGRETVTVGGVVGWTPDAYDALVAALYAARDEADWRAPMTDVMRMTSATALQLVCVQPATRQMVVSVPVGASAGSRVADWLADGQPEGTRQRVLWAMKEGDCVTWDGVLGARFPADDRWWQDTVREARAAEVIVMRLLDRPGVSAWALVMRPAMAQAIAAEASTWLLRAKGHLARALALQAETLGRPVLRNGARGARRLSDQLLDQLCHAVMLVGPEGQIRYANRRATEALAEGRAIQARDGVLGCLQAGDDRRMRAALRLVLAGDPLTSRRPEMQGRAVEVRLSGSASSKVLLVSRLTRHGEAVALVVKHDVAEVARIDPTLIAQVFNLTPAEARIAGMLAQGLTPEQVSDRQGTTLATVRSQIKALFVKTGTNRQVDVVRMVASLPAFESLRADGAAAGPWPGLAPGASAFGPAGGSADGSANLRDGRGPS